MNSKVPQFYKEYLKSRQSGDQGLRFSNACVCCFPSPPSWLRGREVGPSLMQMALGPTWGNGLGQSVRVFYNMSLCPLMPLRSISSSNELFSPHYITFRLVL